MERPFTCRDAVTEMDFRFTRCRLLALFWICSTFLDSPPASLADKSLLARPGSQENAVFSLISLESMTSKVLIEDLYLHSHWPALSFSARQEAQEASVYCVGSRISRSLKLEYNTSKRRVHVSFGRFTI